MPERPVNRNQAANSGRSARPGREIDVGALFGDHAPFLLRTVERLTGSGDRAEDVVQRVFLIAHQKRHTLTDPEDVRGWLYRVMVNVLRHDRRSIARRIRLGNRLQAESVPDESASPDEELQRRERGARVRATVAKLPFKLREVFVLYELEEVGGKDIAQMLEIPENTVWSRLRLGREKFRKLWTEA